eukprot:sb/3472313/
MSALLPRGSTITVRVIIAAQCTEYMQYWGKSNDSYTVTGVSDNKTVFSLLSMFPSVRILTQNSSKLFRSSFPNRLAFPIIPIFTIFTFSSTSISTINGPRGFLALSISPDSPNLVSRHVRNTRLFTSTPLADTLKRCFSLTTPSITAVQQATILALSLSGFQNKLEIL